VDRVVTIANPRPTAFGGQPERVSRAGLPQVMTRAADWAKDRRRRRYLAAVKRRLRRFDPPAR
jgi:hypothetical protein